MNVKDINKKIVIIIPTFNRHKYLDRLIEHYSKAKVDVYICDSTETKYKPLTVYRNIQYFHYPKLSFPNKIDRILEDLPVEKEYVSFIADDDFLILDTLYKGGKYLEKNKKFVYYSGSKYSYDIDGHNVQILKEKCKERIVGNIAGEKRAKLFFRNYQNILWGLYRIEVLKDIFNILSKIKLNNDNFIEITLGSLLCSRGYLFFSSDLWLIRKIHQTENWGSRHKRISNETIKNADLVEDKDNIEHQIYLTSINKDLTIFRLALETYLGRADYKVKSKMKKLYHRFFRKIKKIFKNSLQSLKKDLETSINTEVINCSPDSYLEDMNNIFID